MTSKHYILTDANYETDATKLKSAGIASVGDSATTTLVKSDHVHPTQILYGSCSTASGTASKEVTCEGYELKTGSRIIVTFANANSVANPTLDVNSTGAKAIYHNGSAIVKDYIIANSTHEFIYDGTQYVLVGEPVKATLNEAGIVTYADKTTLNVGDGKTYSTITSAINAMANVNRKITINVYAKSGGYTENITFDSIGCAVDLNFCDDGIVLNGNIKANNYTNLGISIKGNTTINGNVMIVRSHCNIPIYDGKTLTINHNEYCIQTAGISHVTIYIYSGSNANLNLNIITPIGGTRYGCISVYHGSLMTISDSVTVTFSGGSSSIKDIALKQAGICSVGNVTMPHGYEIYNSSLLSINGKWVGQT